MYFLNIRTFIFLEKGKWINNKISISKIINKIINKKNRTENGFRLELNLSIPHSKALLDSREFISNQRETTKIRITKTKVIIELVNIEITKFILSKYPQLINLIQKRSSNSKFDIL